jgi:hypothetical protein
VPHCPNCQGSHISKVVEKQSGLIEQFKANVNQIVTIIAPLEQFMAQLNETRQKISRFRQELPVCLHYPTIESELLIVFKLFDTAKANLYEQVGSYFAEVQRHLSYIYDIARTFPSNLPFIADILKNLTREREKLLQNARDSMGPLDKRFTEISGKLTIMEEIHDLFVAFSPHLTLEQDEKIVYGLKCKLADGSSSSGDLGSKNGTILVTSKRIYFYVEQGVFKKKTVLLFSVKLDDLQQVGVKGRLKKTVSLDFVNSMYNFSLTKEKREQLVEWIENARVFESRNTLDTVNAEKLDRYKLNMKIFREELESAIYELIGFPNSPLLPQQMRMNPGYQNTPPIPLGGPIRNPTNPRGFGMPPTQSSMGENLPSYIGQQFPSRRPQGQPRTPRPMYTPNMDPIWENPDLDRLRTPRGGFGLPHMQPLTPPRVQTNANGQSFNPNGFNPSGSFNFPDNFSDGYPSADATEYENPSRTTMPKSPSNNGFGPAPMGPRSNPNSGMGYGNPRFDPLHNCCGSHSMGNKFPSANQQKLDLQQQLSQLKQEEFGLIQTIKMLESRFDEGTMNNVEFVKSYKTLQKDLYMIQERQRQIQTALAN